MEEITAAQAWSAAVLNLHCHAGSGGSDQPPTQGARKHCMTAAADAMQGATVDGRRLGGGYGPRAKIRPDSDVGWHWPLSALC